MKSSLSAPTSPDGSQSKKIKGTEEQILRIWKIHHSLEFSSERAEQVKKKCGIIADYIAVMQLKWTTSYDRILLVSLPLDIANEIAKTKPKETKPEPKEPNKVFKDQSHFPRTWSSRWVAFPLGYLLSKKQREEWIGDLNETKFEMLEQAYPLWLINTIIMLKTVRKIPSILGIKITDLLSK